VAAVGTGCVPGKRPAANTANQAIAGKIISPAAIQPTVVGLITVRSAP